MFTVACIQTNSQDNVEENIRTVGVLVKQAHDTGAQFITLPENVFAMEAPGTAKTYSFTHENHPGIAAGKAWAREMRCHILIGSVAIASPHSGKRFNRSLLIDDAGNEVAHYDKIHLFDVDLGSGETYSESARMAPGSKAVVAATPWGRLGMSICYDVRFAQLYRALAQAGADFLSVPSAFTVPTGTAHWHVLLRARAIETGCFVFAPAQCGAHPGGRRTFGHSLVVAPWGEIIAEAGEEPGIITAKIDSALVAQARRRMPSLTHDRDFE